MVAPCAGIIKNAVVLGGTLLKKQGDKVEAGEKLVGAYFSVGDEELSVKPTEVVARVQLVCERTFESETPQESVATALLYVENLGGKVLELFPNGNQTKVSYAVTLRMNM
jgi:hypothetical protein